MNLAEELPFLRSLFHRPDQAAYAAYADWLEERGDERARLVRQAALRVSAWEAGQRTFAAPRFPGDPVWASWLSSAGPNDSGWRFDLAQVADGRGRIEIRGTQESVLLVDGQPTAMNWADCAGSIGQYVLLTGNPASGNQHVGDLRALAAHGPDERPLADQVQPLLSALCNGLYGVTFTPSGSEHGSLLLEFGGPPTYLNSATNYYPDPRPVIATQPEATLDPRRVEFFSSEILRGARPVVIAIAGGSATCEFVIDGHHKLLAYQRARIGPALFSLYRYDAPEVSAREGVSYLPAGHALIPEYQRMRKIVHR